MKGWIWPKWGNRSIIRIGVVGIFSLLSIFLILSVCSIVLLNKDDDEKPNEYHVLKYDPSKNVSSFGYVSILQGLSEDQFLSFENVKKEHILVSHLEIDKFICSGSCYCENERRIGIPIVRNIIYLVAAVTSISALELANKHFTEDCEHRISSSDECPHRKIISEVDDCVSSSTTMSMNTGGSKKKEKKLKFGKDYLTPEQLEERWSKKNYYHFYCRGNCLTFEFDQPWIYKDAKAFGCEEIDDSGSIFFYYDDIKISKYPHMYARKYFREEYLEEYCLEKGEQFGYEGEVETGPMFVRFCVGNLYGSNKSVKCIELDD